MCAVSPKWGLTATEKLADDSAHEQICLLVKKKVNCYKHLLVRSGQQGSKERHLLDCMVLADISVVEAPRP